MADMNASWVSWTALACAGLALGLSGYAFITTSRLLTPPIEREVPLGVAKQRVESESPSLPARSVSAQAPVIAPEAALALGAEVVFLRKEVAALQVALVRLQREVQARTQPSAGVSAEVAAPAPKPRRDLEGMALNEQFERLQLMDTVDAEFQKEPHDPHWSAMTESHVEDALAHLEAPPGILRSIECRAQTCRVEMANLSDAYLADNPKAGALSVEKLLPMLATEIADSLPAMTAFEVGSGASTETVLYFSRTADTEPTAPARH